MAERAEAFDSMVCAHTACTDPAEEQIVLRDVHDRALMVTMPDVVRSSTLPGKTMHVDIAVAMTSGVLRASNDYQ
jgi:hypothetical protein